jgi:hypothetical protein
MATCKSLNTGHLYPGNRGVHPPEKEILRRLSNNSEVFWLVGYRYVPSTRGL